MAYCEKCGAQLAEGAKFCPACGTSAKAGPEGGNAQNVDLGATWQDVNNTKDTTEQFDPTDIQQNKTMAVFSYLGILVLIPLLAAKDSKFARYHANQGLVLLIVDLLLGVVLNVVGGILIAISWQLGFLVGLMNLLWIPILILVILGIVNAANGRAKQLPLIGSITLLK